MPGKALCINALLMIFQSLPWEISYSLTVCCLTAGQWYIAAGSASANSVLTLTIGAAQPSCRILHAESLQMEEIKERDTSGMSDLTVVLMHLYGLIQVIE